MTEIRIIWKNGKQFVKLEQREKQVGLRELTNKRLTCKELSKVLDDFPDFEINGYLRTRLKSGETITAFTKEEKEEQERFKAELKKEITHSK